MAASMSRGRARLLVLPFLLAGGCDALTVKTYAGSLIEMDVAGTVTPSKPGEHFEVWTRDPYNDILRIDGYYDEGRNLASFGIQVRIAMEAADPCMIDDQGNLLWTAAAYPHAVTIAGVTQTPHEQAQQVRNRIKQLTDGKQCFIGTTPLECGTEPSTFLIAVPYYEDPNNKRPDFAADPAIPAATRLVACKSYWGRDDTTVARCNANNQPIQQCDRNPLTYTANPAQVTAPLHGYNYGPIQYVTQTPPTTYSGIRYETPVKLAGTVELWLTRETVPLDQVDPLHRGPVFLVGKMDRGGINAIHFSMPNLNGVHGFASILVNLDQPSDDF